MEFYLKDFTEDVQEIIKKHWPNITEDTTCAALCDPDEQGDGSVCGTWEQISDMVSALAAMGYTDLHIWTDGEYWTLQYHNPEFTGMRWALVL